MKRKVVITGMGCVSGLGCGVAETWRRALGGDGAIKPFVPPEGSDLPHPPGPAAQVDRAAVADRLAALDLKTFSQLDALSRFALVAADEAVTQAGLAGHPVLDRRTAVIVGCGSPGNATIEAGYERLLTRGLAKVHPQTIPSSMISAPASHIAMLLGCHGPAMVLSSACASSAHALGEAAHMIRSGRVDAAITGGSEASLAFGPRVAWQSLGVVAPDTCRPFSRDRKGLVLGEGAAMLVFEAEDHAVARGAAILGELAGYGASSDAAQITAPEQSGVEAAIRAAHADAQVSPATPALIAAHGTGTRLNDVVEAAALHGVYGDALAYHTVIATKSAHGHLIGAAAALQFVIGMTALIERGAPPVLGYLGPDPACDVPLAIEPQQLACDVLVSNSFAFGGLNAVLIGRIFA